MATQKTSAATRRSARSAASAASRKRKRGDDDKKKNKKSKTPKTAARASPPAALNEPPRDVLVVLVCGNGEAGELGLGPHVTEAKRPRLNTFLDPNSAGSLHVVQLACGGMHSVALTRDNQIATWGVNDLGALGRDTAWAGGLRDADSGDSNGSEGDLNPRESTPTAVPAAAFPAGTVFVQVAAGDSCSLALTDDGQVYGWGTFRTPDGKEHFGLDGNRKLIKKQLTPRHIPGLQNITQIVCGANHALALDAAGTVWSWGSGDQNQLGRRLVESRARRRPGQFLARGGGGGAPSALAATLTPQPIHIGPVRYIASGEFHSFAVDVRDRVWGWGLNSFGEAGGAPASAGREGAALALPHPTIIPGLARKGVAVLAGGAHHSAAVTGDGTCLAWGRLDGGQLGVALSEAQLADRRLVRYDERNTPRICLKPTAARVGEAGGDAPTVAHVACGTEHTIVVDTAGTAYGTGFNAQSQLGLGTDDDVETLQAIRGKQVAKRKIVWAGAGGQFSILASLAKDEPKEEGGGE